MYVRSDSHNRVSGTKTRPPVSQADIQSTEDSKLKSTSGFLTDNHENTSFLLPNPPQKQYWPLALSSHQIHTEPCSSTLLLCLSRHWDEPRRRKRTRRYSAVLTTVHRLNKMHFRERARSFSQMKIGFGRYATWTTFLSEHLHREATQILFRRDLNNWQL